MDSLPILNDPPVKCQKCRFHLCSYSSVLDSHGREVDDVTKSPDTPPACSTEVWYIPEDKLAAWMKVNVDTGEWVKGKLNCPKCQTRIGSYNFVSGMKCTCESYVLPPIHIIKSKVDVIRLPEDFYFAQPIII